MELEMKFSSLIQDDTGALSSMRIMSLFVVVPVMVVWTVLSIKRGDFIVPDAKIITLVVSAMGCKSIQSFSENFSPPSQTQNQTPPSSV